MSESRVSLRSETASGLFEVTITISQEHELFRRILDYAFAAAGTPSEQIPLPFPSRLNPGTEAPAPAATAGGLYCKTEGCEKEPHPGTGYCRRCMSAIDEIKAAQAAEAARKAAEAEDGQGDAGDTEPVNPPGSCADYRCSSPATKKTGYCRRCNKLNREAEENAKRAAGAAAAGGSLCVFPGCDEPPYKSGRCYQHFKADLTAGRICATADCPGGATPTGLCAECMKGKDTGRRPSARAGEGTGGD